MGNGTGPLRRQPTDLAMSLSSLHTSSSFVLSVLVSRILAFWTKGLEPLGTSVMGALNLKVLLKVVGGGFYAFSVISLTMPAAIVVPMSLIAKRPSCGKSEYASTAIGCRGLNFTIAPSPVFRNAGFSSTTCPVLGSIF